MRNCGRLGNFIFIFVSLSAIDSLLCTFLVVKYCCCCCCCCCCGRCCGRLLHLCEAIGSRLPSSILLRNSMDICHPNPYTFVHFTSLSHFPHFHLHNIIGQFRSAIVPDPQVFCVVVAVVAPSPSNNNIVLLQLCCSFYFNWIPKYLGFYSLSLFLSQRGSWANINYHRRPFLAPQWHRHWIFVRASSLWHFSRAEIALKLSTFLLKSNNKNQI